MDTSPPAKSPPARKRTAPRGTASYPRKRAVTACQVCRARRTKCDNKKPSCSFCTKIGAKCVTNAVDFSAFDPASLEIIDRLDRLEGLLAAQPGQTHQCSAAGVTKPLTEQTGAEKQPMAQTQCSRRCHPLRIISSDVLSWPVFGGRWEREADALTRLRSTPPEASPSSVPYASSPSVEGFLDNPGASEALLERFFQHVHIKNPILEMVELRRMVRHVCLEGLGWNAESCLVLLIWTLGAISTPFDDPDPCTKDDLDLASSLFGAAAKRLGTLYATSGVLPAQCFFYAGVYLMSVFQPKPAWRHFIQALACCQNFEFSMQAFRDGRLSLEGGAEQAPAMEQRLYWSCWKSEVELRMCLGLVDFQVQDRVYPGPFPTPPAEPDRDSRAWFFYLAEISLRRLNTRTRNDIGRLSQPESGEKNWQEMIAVVVSYEEQFRGWLDSLPETISLWTAPEDDDVLKFILRCHVADFHELLYWVFTAAAINQKERTPAVDDYARKGLDAAMERLTTAEFGFRYRHHGTWMLLQSCTRSAIILLAALQSGSTREMLPEKWQEMVSLATDMLEFWLEDDESGLDQLSLLRRLRGAIV